MTAGRMRLAARALLAALLLAAGAASAAGRFTLSETQSPAVSGPFAMYHGAKVRVAGRLYELSIAPDGRITFISLDKRESFGPYQPVAGRIMRIGGAMYAFGWQEAPPPRPPAPPSSGATRPGREAPIAEFAPLPPKPGRIAIPGEPERRRVAPLDLPALPDATKPLSCSAWLAPVDKTPFKWKAGSASGSETELERTSVGAGLSFNSWLAEARLSTGVQSGNVLPDGLGLSRSSIDDGSGWAVAVGYKRPVLSEGGWTASVGFVGRLRRDKGDLSATSLVSTGEADTNNLGNVYSRYETRTSSVTITEKSLCIDLALSYSGGAWGASVDVLLQPFSDTKVSGGLLRGDDVLELSAEHSAPIGVRLGGWLGFGSGWRATADLELALETCLRLGVSYDF